MRINKIYVIALDTNRDSLQQTIEEKLQSCGFYENTPYEIISAFDGREGDIEEGYTVYDKWDVGPESPYSWNDWWRRPVLPGEVGCAISHRKVWEAAVFDGLGPILILEEDFFNEGNSMSMLAEPPVDTNWDVALLGRDIIEKEVEEEVINETWLYPRHWYNAHAYIIKNPNVAKLLLSGGLKENVIPVDEYLSALGYPHRRHDIQELFPKSLTILATRDQSFIVQNRGGKLGGSTIEPEVGSPNQPEIINQEPEQTQTEYVRPEFDTDASEYFEILDTSNWDEWKEKYINLSVSKGEYDLMVSDRGDNVYEFPLFTPKFCREAIALAEAKDKWTIDRHEHYPTNDVLLQDIGLDKIYNKVLHEVVRPLAIHQWKLEGKQWDAFSNENFMARYTTTRQSHLSLHHDRSHLTMVIKLNDEFSGGGTWFPQYQKLSNPDQIGTAVLHPGMITHRHGARPITSGKRYIIVSFIRNHEEP